MKAKPAWSWDIYEQELARDARRATRVAAKQAAAKETSPRIHATADRAGGREGSAPEGTSGAAARRVLIPANVDQQHTRIRNVGETPSPPQPAQAAPPALWQAAPAPASAPPVQTRPAERIVLPEIKAPAAPANFRGGCTGHFGALDRYAHARPPADMARFRAALAERAAAAATRPAPTPIERATSREECARCGVPGFKGCAHQLPYAPPGPENEPFDYRGLVDREESARRYAYQRRAGA